MIYFILTREHQYTVAEFRKRKTGVKIGVMSYRRLFSRRSLPSGTYIFSDLERLMPWELHLAAKIAGQLKVAGDGFRVLNDPARVKTRVELLRSLFETGINQFNVYRADELKMPERYPVFIRWENDHGFPLSDLIYSEGELRRELEHLRQDGCPLRGMIITEYAAQPVEDALYRKFASYCVGGQVIAHHYVHDDQWNVKYGKAGIASDAAYQNEYRFVVENHYEEELRKVFKIADIDYGRVDFGLVDGQIQVYEINTNPMVPAGKSKVAIRQKTLELARDNLFSALDAQDIKTGRKRPYKLSVGSKGLYRRSGSGLLGRLLQERQRP